MLHVTLSQFCLQLLFSFYDVLAFITQLPFTIAYAHILIHRRDDDEATDTIKLKVVDLETQDVSIQGLQWPRRVCTPWA